MTSFILNHNTEIKSDIAQKPVQNAVRILERDIKKRFKETDISGGDIVLEMSDGFKTEDYEIAAGDDLIIRAGDNLGFVYALLYISEKFLGIKPFWFWLDQRIEKTDSISVKEGVYKPRPAAVKYRGWFLNDEVLILKWSINGDSDEPWRMAFEALLRCGGNLVIPGTDKSSRKYRQLASDMGLWITHHHAEPLGAEMFVRAYPDKQPNFMENSELFYKLWEEAVKEQAEYNVIWNLCFRGQGDNPFWSSDTTGRFDTPKKRADLINDVIKKQCELVKKYVKDPVFCTNLYGEIMELYSDGLIDIDKDIIKVRADNGYGKMIARRRDNHVTDVPSMPEKGGGHQGIYYHVSFYDLQAANHITMLPNSVDFVNSELDRVLENDGGDFWVINCSNVRPHVYYLDAVRKKWYGESLTDESHSKEFVNDYYGGDDGVARCLAAYPKMTLHFGKKEHERAGEQLYTENARIIANALVRGDNGSIGQLRWIAGDGDFYEQTSHIGEICREGIDRIDDYCRMCADTSDMLDGQTKELFDATVLLQAKLHRFGAHGLLKMTEAVLEFKDKNYKKAFVLMGEGAELFDAAEVSMRSSESGVWKGFYKNDCFADYKHSAYMARKAMGTVREFGDNARHDKWYRDTVYSKEDRNVMLLLVLDNHMTDWELYEAMKENI